MSINELLEQLQSRNIKLQVIDGKLKVFDVDGQLDNELIKQLKVNKAQLLQVFSQSKGFTPSDFPFANLNQQQLDDIEIKYQQVENIYPAVPMQQGMLYHGFVDGTGQSYTSQTCYELSGQLNVDAFVQAWALMTERHAIFRTCFVGFETQTINQLVLSEAQIPYQHLDWSTEQVDTIDDKLAQFYREDKAKGFDFAKAPLMRLTKIDLPLLPESEHTERSMVVWTHHHSLLDGWCSRIVFKEVMQSYDSIVNQQASTLAPTPAYENYIKWLVKQDNEKAHQFWADYLQGFNTYTPLVLDKKAVDEAQTQDHDLIGRRFFELDKATTANLNQLCNDAGYTMNTAFQGAWAFLLACFSGETDVVFGATVSGRPAELAGVENMVGLFINSLPVRVKFDQINSVDELLADLTQSFARSNEYGFCPLNEIQRHSELVGGQPIFDSLINYSNLPAQEFNRSQGQSVDAGEGLKLLSVKTDEHTNYGLTFAVNQADSLKIRITYPQGRFDHDVVEKIGGYLLEVLTAMSGSLEVSLSQLSLLNAAEQGAIVKAREQLLAANDATAKPLLIERFAQSCQANPDGIAISFLAEKLTFKALNIRANQLANLLIDKGITANDVVGLCLERSEDIPIAILAIWKIGASYVPLDRGYPKNRLQRIIQDAGLALLIVHDNLVALPGLAGIESLCIDHPQVIDELASYNSDEVTPTNDKPNPQAYIIYTSGSSGQPKGVAVGQNSVSQYADIFANQLADCHLSKDTPWLWHVSYTFDASIKALVSLCHGATVSIASENQCIDQFELIKLLRQGDIKIFNGAPMLVKQVLEGFEQDDNYHLILSGDAISNDLYQQVLTYTEARQLTAINAYGPTELTVNAAYKVMSKELDNRDIGPVVSGSHGVILSVLGNVMPSGLPGELAICGQSVCLGYLNSPQKNEAAFWQDSLNHDSNRYYKTGDRVVMADDGELTFIGRKDHQVKVRGYRIELGEIDLALAALDGVKRAVVTTKDAGLDNKVIIAYCTTDEPVSHEDKPQASQELLFELSNSVPDYMLPVHLVVLDSFPLTPAGKIDHTALPDPLAQRSLDDDDQPRTELEVTLLGLFKQVLNQKSIGIHDNFFAVGGDSIVSMQLMAKAKRQGIHFTARQLLLALNVRKLAALIESEHVTKAQQSQSQGIQTLMPIQQRFFDIDSEHVDHCNQSTLFSVAADFDLAVLSQALVAVVRRHDVLRLQFFTENDKWYGRYIAMNSAAIKQQVSQVDLSQVSDEQIADKLWEIGSEIQQSFDIRVGALFKAVHFDLGDNRAGRVMLAFHHLVIDGVSWRVLLQDLEQALAQISSGKVVSLDDKTGSYQRFAELVKEQAQSGAMDEDRDYWLNFFNSDIKPLPNDAAQIDKPDDDNYGYVEFALTESQTNNLSAIAGSQGGSGIENIALTAINSALQQYSGESIINIDLESHGRQWPNDSVDAPDVSDVMGWFTNIYPLQLALTTSSQLSPLEQVAQAKANIPNGGFGYAALKYYGSDIEIRRHLQSRSAYVVFNYLGQLDNVLEEHGIFAPATETIGPQVAHDRQSPYQLQISAYIQQGQLWLKLSYDVNEFHDSTMTELGDTIKSALEDLIATEQPKIKADAAHAGGRTDGKTIADEHNILIPLNQSKADWSLFCLHPVGGYANHYVTMAKGIEKHCQVYGLQAPDIFTDVQTTCAVQLAADYVELIKKQQPQGPYRLLGWSAGAKLAYEVACQLTQDGQSVDFVGLLDQSPALSAKQDNEKLFDKVSRMFGNKLDIDWAQVEALPVDQGINMVAEQVNLQNLRNEGLSEDAVKNYIRFQVTFPQAMDALVAKPSALDLDLFVTMDEQAAERYQLSSTYNWEQVSSGTINRYRVAGEHSDMVERPYVSALIDALIVAFERLAQSGSAHSNAVK